MSADLTALIKPLQPFARALIDLGGRAGVQPRVTSTIRSHSLQQRLYNAFLRGETKYPVAPPGKSAHEYGFAFDMVADSRENLHDLGQVWRAWGGLWSPNDEVHFEFPGFNPDAVHDPYYSECDPLDWRRGSVLNPDCACKAVDFFAGKFTAALLAMEFPESTILEFLSQPCSVVLQEAAKLGL